MLLEGKQPRPNGAADYKSSGAATVAQKQSNRKYHLNAQEVITSQRQQALGTLEGKIPSGMSTHIAHFASKWI